MTESQPITGRILVVDDNQDVCRSLTRILKHLGFDGQYAASGLEALQKVSQQTPDLIILDIMMPGMDGMEVLDRLKADDRFRTLPVVMFSAITDDESRQRALRRGAVDYWVKASVNFTELGARLRKLLDSSRPN